MQESRWKEIESIYFDLLSLPPNERAAAMQERCSGDEHLRQEVASLLEAREQAQGFLSAVDVSEVSRESSQSRILSGEHLGPYELIASVGAGAMGEVYLARDSRLGRNVALKVLPSTFTRDSERVARFQREARLASALNHPNIITIYDIGQVGETWYLAAEFVDGVTIRERLRFCRISLEEALGIATQCTRALAAAHQAGIIHRDIKPENIMIRPDGEVKVVDFGLARVAGHGAEIDADATQSGALLGTPRYMSPEQARGQQLDFRTDIFSLGAVLFEMVAGKPAFAGDTAADVFAALLGPARPALSQSDWLAAPELDAILSKALNPDLGRRYHTMQAFGRDLERVQDQLKNGSRVEEPPATPSRLNQPGGIRITRRALAGGALSLGGLGLAAYGLTRRFRTAADRPPSSVVPLTSFGGNKDFGAFSPDGTRIAFSWNGGKGEKTERSIYVKPIGAGDPVRVTFAAEDDRLPVWSPDGRQIAFCRRVQGIRYAVYVVNTSNGAERKISEGALGVSWSAEGKTLAIANLRGDGGGLHLIDVDTGIRRQLTAPSPNSDILPVFSLGGKWIAFTRLFGFASREIFVIAREGGQPKQLTFDKEPTYGVTWTADSREVVFSSNRGRGGESLWRVSRSGGTPQRIQENSTGAGFYPSISTQGNRLAYTVSFKDTNLYAYEGAGFQGRSHPARFNSPRNIVSSSRRDDSLNISPSGVSIAFVSKRTGDEEIWVCNRDGGGQRQLTHFNGPGTGTPRWSPDGEWIAFDSLVSGNPDIYLMRADGSQVRRLTSGQSSNYMPSWSADGKWIFHKSDRSGADQIWKLPVAGGETVRVTRSGAVEAFESPDGKLIYYTKNGFGPLWRAPAAGGTEELVPELKSFDRIYRSWGVHPEGIYFISRERGTRQTIRFFSFATRQVRPLVVLDREPVWDYPDVALSADGRQLICAVLDQEVNDLMLIENFH